jgi:hypothetical protein
MAMVMAMTRLATAKAAGQSTTSGWLQLAMWALYVAVEPACKLMQQVMVSRSHELQLVVAKSLRGEVPKPVDKNKL